MNCEFLRSVLRHWFRRTEVDLEKHLGTPRDSMFDLERRLIRQLAFRLGRKLR